MQEEINTPESIVEQTTEVNLEPADTTKLRGPVTNLNVTSEMDFTKQLSNPRLPSEVTIVSIPRYTAETFRENFGHFEKQYVQYMEYQAKRPGSKINNWIGMLVDSSTLTLEGDALRGAINREGSNWGQKTPVNNDTPISAQVPVLSTNTRKLEGAAGLTQAKSHMGLVGTVNVPLYHSGFWVTFQTPSLSDDLNLNDILANAKDEIGYLTNGLIFSADSYMLQRSVVDHALNHVIDCSSPNYSKDWFYDNILITDIPLLIWGVACATWSKGFVYNTPCISNPAQCNYIHEEKLNLRRLQWVDRNALTDRQKLQLAKRIPNRYTEFDIEQYKKEHRYLLAKTTSAKMSANTRLLFKVPTLREFFESGDLWLERIKRTTEASLRKDMTTNQRAELMLQQGRVTTLQQFAHFVSAIEINRSVTNSGFDDDVEWNDQSDVLMYDDRDHIAELLAEASSNDEMYQSFMDAIQKFQNDVVVSLIGIPTFNCPKCGNTHESMESPHPDLVPLEVARIFFILVAQRVAGALSRQ